MKIKRMFSFVLTLLLAAGLFGGMAFAAGGFADVPDGAYYADAVQWAVEKKITNGTGPSTFSPDATCTRAEMVTFLWRASGSPTPKDTKNPFTDVSPGAYYYTPVLWAVSEGITNGTSATTFSPDKTVSRAEAVTFIWRDDKCPPYVDVNPYQDVPNVGAFYTTAVLWANAYGITNGTSANTFSPDAPCTRAQIVTFLWRIQEFYPGSELTSLKTNYPVVLVHGLLGWGSYDELNPYIPYWGMTACDVVDHLRTCGADVYAASVGPISSAWDRACELYAQLKGTVTDYGAAHAKLHGHDRYGRDYSGAGQYSKLIPGPWDAQHPVNLVGHSFGGATSRTLLDLLVDGSAEEQAYMKAHPEEGAISPLFLGGKGDWIYSLTALAAPSNGTTFIEANHGFTDFMEDLTRELGRIIGLTPFKGIYDLQLEHFGIQPVPGASLQETLQRVWSSGFDEHHDSAYQDLTIDRSMLINQDIEMQPNVYYFSYYGNRTEYQASTDMWVPNNRLQILAYPFSYNMCQYIGDTEGTFVRGYGDESYTVTVPKTHCDRSWQPNDGLVNVVSGRWPYHFADSIGTIVEDAHREVTTPIERNAPQGVWTVFPVRPYDHLTFMGSIFNENGKEVNAFYHDVFYNIVYCGG